VSGLVGPPSRWDRRRQERGEVRNAALHAIALAILFTAGLVLALSVHAPRPDLAERYYAASLAALVLEVLVRALAVSARTKPGATFEELTARTAAADQGPPDELVSLELAVRLGANAAGDYHVRLRPVLVDLARQRLAKRGVRLEAPRHRERAEALLGPEVFEMVRGGASLPDDRFAPGPGERQVERATAALERLS
jgi:hypothetical protein